MGETEYLVKEITIKGEGITLPDDAIPLGMDPGKRDESGYLLTARWLFYLIPKKKSGEAEV